MPLQFIFFLLLHQINVILTICGCWLLQNLENRDKRNKFKRLQIKVFSSKCFCFSFSFYLFSEVLIIPQ